MIARISGNCTTRQAMNLAMRTGEVLSARGVNASVGEGGAAGAEIGAKSPEGRQASPACISRVVGRPGVLVWTEVAGERGGSFAERAFYCWPGQHLGL